MKSQKKLPWEIEKPKMEARVKTYVRDTHLELLFKDENIKAKCLVNVVLGRHRSENDAKKYEELIKESDAVLIEFSDWTEKDEIIAQNISDGKSKAESFPESNYQKFHITLARIFQGTSKPIGFLDLPETHKLSAMDPSGEVSKAEKDLFTKYSASEKNVEDYMMFLEEYLEVQVTRRWFHKSRETYMTTSLESTIKRVLKHNPELLKKPEIKIAIIIGSYHLPIVKTIESIGFRVKGEMQQEAGVSKRHELGWKLDSPDAEGIVNATQMELLEHVVTRAIVAQAQYATKSETDKRRMAHAVDLSKIVSKIVKQLEPNDAYNVFKELTEVQNSWEIGQKVNNIVKELCQRKNISYPETIEDFEKLAQGADHH